MSNTEKDTEIIDSKQPELLDSEQEDLDFEDSNPTTSSSSSQQLPAFYLPSFPEELEKETSKDVVPYDPLQRYLTEIRSIPMLSKEEEHALALRSKQGDKVAGYKLVFANLRLVVLVAREYQRNVQNILDLIQEGNIGLLEAVKKFDPLVGIRFPSYAIYWVRAYILRYLINNIRLVKIGTTQAQRKLFFNLVKEKEQLEREGFIPEAKLLAERLNVKESEVIEMQQRLALPDLSVDAPVRTGDESVDLHGVLADETQNAEEIVVKEQFEQSVREVLEEYKKGCDAKEQAIIDQRLFTDEPVTLQAIAEQFRVSRERIRQIEARIKSRLKELMKDKLGLDSEGESIADVVDDERG